MIVWDNEVWTVEGSYVTTPTGIAIAEIRLEDGKILRVSHGEWPGQYG